MQTLKHPIAEVFGYATTDFSERAICSTLISITTPEPGKIDEFLHILQEKLDDQLESAPINQCIENLLL